MVGKRIVNACSAVLASVLLTGAAFAVSAQDGGVIDEWGEVFGGNRKQTPAPQTPVTAPPVSTEIDLEYVAPQTPVAAPQVPATAPRTSAPASAGMPVTSKSSPKLVMRSFTGGTGNDGETLAALFSIQNSLKELFDIVPEANADWALTGHIGKTGVQNVFIVSITHVRTQRILTGNYRTYRGIEEIPAAIPSIAEELAKSTRQRSGSKAPRLAIAPFHFADKTLQTDAMDALERIFPIAIANTGKYNVRPIGTPAFDAVVKEIVSKKPDFTDSDKAMAAGSAANADHVLLVDTRRLGNMNMLIAQIFDAKDGRAIAGETLTFGAIDDATAQMSKFTAQLTSTSLPEYKIVIRRHPAAGGQVIREPDLPVYDVGTKVVLTAVPAAGYVFSGWSGNLTNASPRVSFTMGKDVLLNANFKDTASERIKAERPPTAYAPPNYPAARRSSSPAASAAQAAPPPGGGVDMTGSIAQIVGDLVREKVGGKFGQAVGNAVSEIVVNKVRNELARRGVSADDNVGQVVGKIVAQTVSEQVAQKVPGPAGKMGGNAVGKAVGTSVEKAVNDILGGKKPGDGGSDYAASSSRASSYSGAYDGGGSTTGTRIGFRAAWNESEAQVRIYDTYNNAVASHLDFEHGNGYEIGLVINTGISPRWSFEYGADIISRRPVNASVYSYEVTEVALAIPALFRVSGTSEYSGYCEFGPKFDFPLHVKTSKSYHNHKIDRNRIDVGFAFGGGFNFGRYVSLGLRIIAGTVDFTDAQSGRKMFQDNPLNLTIMFGER